VGASPFAGLAGTQVFASGNYFDTTKDGGPFTGVCRIRDMIVKNTFKSGTSVIVELEVLTSNLQNVPPGTVKGCSYPLAKAQISRPNLIALLAAILGFDRRNQEHLGIVNGDVTRQSEQMLDAGCNRKVFNGMLVTVSSRAHETKEKQMRTVTDFSPAPNAAPGQGIKG
jgi:hypothetical protein